MKGKKINQLYGVPDQEGQIRFLLTKGGPRQGAGRKGFGVTKKVSLTLTEDLWFLLDEQGEKDNKTRSELLREIISEYYREGHNSCE